MRKFAFLAIALVVVGALVGSRIVGAQETQPGIPAICTDANYDFNHDGIIARSDTSAWAALASQCLDRVSGDGFVSAEACRQAIGDEAFDLLDVNGDGAVDTADAIAVGQRWGTCFPSFARLPR